MIEGAHAKKTHMPNILPGNASKGSIIPSITKGNHSSHASSTGSSSSSYVRTIPLDGKLQLSSFIGTPEDLTLRITIPGIIIVIIFFRLMAAAFSFSYFLLHYICT